MRRQFVAALGRYAVVHAQRPVDGRGGGEAHRVAEVVAAGAAGVAGVAGSAWFESDAVAGGEAFGGGVGAAGGDDSGGFVAEDEGGVDDEAA